MAQKIIIAAASNKPKLLDQVRDIIRRKHYSIRTEQAYIDWIKRFIIYHGKRHPGEMAEEEVAGFLTHLARDLNVAASTQNQALSALLFDSFVPGSVGLSACPSDSRLPSPLGSLQRSAAA